MLIEYQVGYGTMSSSLLRISVEVRRCLKRDSCATDTAADSDDTIGGNDEKKRMKDPQLPLDNFPIPRVIRIHPKIVCFCDNSTATAASDLTGASVGDSGVTTGATFNRSCSVIMILKL